MLVNPATIPQGFFDKNIDKISRLIGTPINDFVDSIVLAVSNGFWSSILGFVSCLIFIYMIWACFSIMMMREKMWIPPFGETKPIDCIYFMGCFYMIISIVKAMYHVI